MNTLDNQVAVVTGASSGIGKAIALELARRGAKLCLVGRKLETLREVAEAASGSAAGHQCCQADLTVDRELDELIANIKRDVGSVDILVHGAGAICVSAFEAPTAAQLDSQYGTNMRAPYLLTQGLMPVLQSRQGQVLFVNSSAGLATKMGAGAYGASKHALKAIADSLREEVNPRGVRVLSLFLGRTATPMQATIFAMEGKPYHPELLMQPEDVAAMAAFALTLPRSIEVTDISMRPLLKSY